MLRWIFRLIFKLNGWKLRTDSIKGIDQSIVIAAPHTSNWDVVYSTAAFDFMGLPIKFTLKKEWFRFPFNSMVTNLGGIAIDRSPKKSGEARKSAVEAMADLFKQHKVLHIMVTPEGTRSKRTEWKTGFWHTAKMANVPILCGYLDYKNKVAGIGKIIYPTDLEKDMREIAEFYKDIQGKFPEKFSVDLRYV
jgi:1-acyl-sn-glycerol-3-phosphate acyltransferase